MSHGDDTFKELNKTRKQIIDELNDIYNGLQDLEDEPLSSIVRKLRNILDAVGSLTQDLEDEESASKETEEN